MVAPSDEDIASLLLNFDALHQDYKDGMSEIQTLKGKLSIEVQKREAAESICAELEKERQRLLKTQGETLSKVVQQLEHRSNYDSLLEQFTSLKQQFANSEKEHEKALTIVGEKNNIEVRELQNQIRQSQEALALRDAAVAHLEQELSYRCSTIEELHQKLEQTQHDVEQKYQHEIDDLKNKLQLLMQEKSMLQEELRNIENQSMIARMGYEKKLRESSFSRHADVFKQKIMRLRKENEDLRSQLLSAHHK